MKSDLYTKSVLTAIAIFLGVIAFEYRPVKEALAYGSEVVSLSVDAGTVWIASRDKVGKCSPYLGRARCEWFNVGRGFGAN